MPALSPTMTEGTLTKWHKNEGDFVEVGDILAEIETDKANMEVEAVDDGVLAKIIVSEGSEGVAVNETIAILTQKGESFDPELSVKTYEKPNLVGKKETKKTNQIDLSSIEHVSNYNSSSFGGQDIDISLGYNGSTSELTVREALRDAMAEEMRIDDTVFLIGEEVAQYEGAYKVSQGLLAEFGDRRVVDTPITEHGFTGLGVGAAFGGLKPIVEFMTFNFAMQAMDQIINSAAKTNYMSGGQMGCPIVFRGPNGAASRVAAQHSQCYASWYAHIPGLKVVIPSSSADAKGLLKAAIRDPDPVIFLENEILYGQIGDVPDDSDWFVPLGFGKIVKKGNDVSIFAFSIMVEKAMEAATILEAEGIDAEIIDLRTLRPLDTNIIIQSIKKTNRAVIAEEGWKFSGIGAEISAILVENGFDYLDAPIARVSAADVPLPYAANLEELALPQAKQIVNAAKSVCYRD